MTRFIIACCVIGLFFLLSLVILPIIWLIEHISISIAQHISYYLVSAEFLLIRLISGVKLDVYGQENIPKNQAVLYVGNHRSYFDIVLNYTVLPPLVGFVSKIEMKKYPLLAQWMVNMNCLFLDRSSPKEGLKMIQKGVEKLTQGISLFIFPEGTRAKSDDSMLEFKAGSFKLAQKAHVPIVPVVINNTSAVFEDQFPKLKKTHVTIEYCEPIYPDSLDTEEKKVLAKTVHDIIEEKALLRMKEL